MTRVSRRFVMKGGRTDAPHVSRVARGRLLARVRGRDACPVALATVGGTLALTRGGPVIHSGPVDNSGRFATEMSELRSE
jgi:hypothetical protein